MRCPRKKKCKLISAEKQDAIPYGQAGQFAIFFPQLFGPASTRPMSKRAHGSAVSENRIERRNFRINPNAQRSSANVEILSKYLIQIEDSFMAQLLSGKLERTN